MLLTVFWGRMNLVFELALYFRGKKESLPEQKNEGIPEIRAAEAAWEMEKRVDKSFIRETFYGQWRSVLSKILL